MNEPSLSFEIPWRDEDLIMVEVKASNGRYAGITHFYTDAKRKELIEFSKRLQGFPKEIEQVIEQKFGYKHKLIKQKFGYERKLEEGPFVNLKFITMGFSKHTAVDIILLEDGRMGAEESKGKVSFRLLFEPSSLDQFCIELSELGKNEEGKAVLVGYVRY
jgi:hypothetical protein